MQVVQGQLRVGGRGGSSAVPVRFQVVMSSPKFHPEMTESVSAILLELANERERGVDGVIGVDGTPVKDGAGGGRGFPRTLSTSVLRIKHRSSFWERFWENHRRLA